MKKIIALVLALMMAFSLVACGGKDEPASTGTSTAASTTDEGAASDPYADPYADPYQQG